MLRKWQFWFPFLLLLTSSFASPPAWAGPSVISLTKSTPVYRGPSTSSEILGRYPAGTRFKVESEEDGWYSIRFSRPFKGADLGWIVASDVRQGVRGGGSPSGRGSRDEPSSPKGPYQFSMGLEYRNYGSNLGAMQTALGEAKSSVSAAYFGLEAVKYFRNRLNLGVGVGSYALALTLQAGAPTVTGETKVSGFMGDLRPGYLVVQTRSLEAYVGAHVGLTYFSLATKTNINAAETAGIMALYYGGSAKGRYRLGSKFALDATLGYQMLTFNAIPKFQGTATQIDLSGIFWGISGSYLW